MKITVFQHQFRKFYIAQHKNKEHLPYPTNPRNMITMSINHSHFVRCLKEEEKDQTQLINDKKIIY